MRLRNIPGAKDAILECDWVIDEPERFKGKWESVFGEKRPLFLEVGMGKGRFLMDMARLHPERNFIGIEMYDSVLLRALQKREELEEQGESFSNLVFIRVDARLLPEIFEKDEVDGIYLNFSDPWPKARHAKRRLTSREFLARYEQVLKKMALWNLRRITGACSNFLWKRFGSLTGTWRFVLLTFIMMRNW